MADDIVDVTFVDRSSQLAVRVDAEPSAPSLFGTHDPVEVIERAVRVANALKAIVIQKKLYTLIKGKEYVHVEAWQTMGIMLGLTCVNEWSRRVDGGWEARANVNDAHGRIIGSAEAQCVKNEYKKDTWEEYALRSMAQTRATSKAFRSVLGFIMVLAGFEGTPVEEMPREERPRAAIESPKRTIETIITQAIALGIVPQATFEEARGLLRARMLEENVPFTISAVCAFLDAYKAPAAPVNADGQRKLAMVLFTQLGYDTSQRHTFYEQVAGYDDAGEPIRSWAEVVAAGKAKRVLDALQTSVKGIPQ